MRIKINCIYALALFTLFGCKEELPEKKPLNILFAISDDQSFAHTSFAGSKFVNTPAFDKIASEGVYFSNCYAGSPGCAPSRSTIVTGRYHWQNEQSGQHASSWMKKHVPFVDLLKKNGYATGLTGKGVAPFKYAEDENHPLWRKTNAAGEIHSKVSYEGDSSEDERFANGINSINYFENFKHFMENVREDKPFFFWFGASEPHRRYEKDSWKRTDKKLADVEVPGFLPDNDLIRGDLLDYAVEIEWFDLHLHRMLEYLESIGELENTVVIVTADNGKPFPRAKANGYEYGVHVPLAIRYPKMFPGNRKVDDLVSFANLAPTILELTETSSEGMLPISGKSILKTLTSIKEGKVDEINKYVFSGRERHSSSRYLNWGYPQRIIRGNDYLYIWNVKPDRWPAGAPLQYDRYNEAELLPLYGVNENGKYIPDASFTDIDDCPSKTFLIENYDNEKIRPYFDLAHGKRPEFELFNVKEDPFCLKNLAGVKAFNTVETELKTALMNELTVSNDPRVVGPDKEVFDSYIRYSRIRKFPKPE